MFTINLDVGNIVLEDSGDIDLHEQSCQSMCNNESMGDGKLMDGESCQADATQGMQGAARARYVLQGRCPWRRRCRQKILAAVYEHTRITGVLMEVWGNTHMSRQVFPQAPSPTMTSFRRISAMMVVQKETARVSEAEVRAAKAEKSQ